MYAFAGNGACGPVGGGDLCICHPFFEGNNCNQAIRQVNMDREGGITSAGLAGIVIGSLVVIPLATCGFFYALHINDCLDD
eukprot:g10866.t1